MMSTTTVTTNHKLFLSGPFGAGNPEPVVALPSHQLVYADEVGQAHLRLRFKDAPWVEPLPKLDALRDKVAARPAFASTLPYV